MPWKLPDINNCCGCVTDLRTAAAIIAVLGIVSNAMKIFYTIDFPWIRTKCFESKL